MTETTSAFPTNATTRMSPRNLKLQIMSRLQIMMSKTTKELTRAKKPYSKYFDRTAKPQPQFKVGEEVYVNKRPMSAATLADRIAATPRSKQLPYTGGPFKVLATIAETLTIDEGGVSNSISTDRETRAPPPATIRTGSLTDPQQEELVQTEEDLLNGENVPVDSISSNQSGLEETTPDEDDSSATALTAASQNEKERANQSDSSIYTVERIIGHM